MQGNSNTRQESFRPKILIVDDTLSNILVIEGLLKSLQVDFDRAFSGYEAIEKVKENEYAMLLLDVQMPELDGFRTAEIIREELEEHHLTIIFISAVYNQNYFYQKGLETGAVDFITKPLVSQVFISKIQIFLKLYVQRKELEWQVEENQKANALLRQSNLAVEKILNNIRVGIYVSDKESNEIIFANRYGQKIHGSNIIGKPYNEVLNIEDITNGSEESSEDESRSHDIYSNKEGRFFHLFENGIKWIDGRQSMLNVEVDITDKVEAQKEMINSHKNFAELFNNSPDAIYVEDEAGTILAANKAAHETHGIDVLAGLHVTAIAPAHMRENINAEYSKWFTGEITYKESKVLRKDGVEMPVDISGKIITYNNSKALLVIVRDITDRQNALQALVDSEQRFRTLFEKIPTVAVYGINENREVIYWNHASENFFGYTMNEAIGRRLEDLIIPGNDQANINEIIDLILDGKKDTTPKEYHLLKKDGSVIPVSSSYVMLKNTSGEKEIYSIDIDLKERDKAQVLQKSRLQLTEFINQISYGFINITINEIDATITKAIEAVSSFAEVDNSYIYLLDEQGHSLEISHKWTSLTKNNLKPVIAIDEVKGLSNFIDELTSTGLEVYPDGQNTVYFTDLMHSMNIESYVHIPMFVNHLFIGFIGFGTSVKGKKWDDHTIYAFKLIAQVSINALERKKAEKTLRETYKRSQESDRLKTAFLANMSHEIRTPMNAILGFSSLLSDPEITSEEQKTFINHINNNGSSLMTLINEILDISKIEAGQIQIKKTKFDLNESINDIMVESEKHKVYQNKNDINITTSFEGIASDLTIETDQMRFKQIVMILIDNALKYTKQGSVKLQIIRLDENLLQFEVADTGIGIPQEMQALIFQSFRQVEETHTRQFGGTGLGLAIAKHLINMMGGEIWVESREGAGSHFFFTLPLAEKASDVAKPKPAQHGLKTKTSRWENRYIIIAEDVEANFELMQALLKKTGINILWAKDGTEAIKIFTWNKKIDMILMDIQMPVMNGFEATQHIKALNPDIPIVALTAFTFAENQEKIFQAGCDSFLPKPIKQNELIEMIDRYLA